MSGGEAVRGAVAGERGDLVSMVHDHGTVHDLDHTADGTRIDATVGEDLAIALRDYLDEDPFAAPVEAWELA